ncbi:Dps family protein [Brevibacillus fluminis]|uniref:Dps family protein n=1 Tax=Brevibacillus fluminis TaxID=511487 RepID=UPI003F89AC3C
MQKTIETLNKQLANWNILYVKLHNYHWFVNGPHFFTLHELFESLYNEAATNIDELAERILMIGGTPAATMKQYLQLASVQEAAGQESTDDMVKAIINDFRQVASESKAGMVTAAQEGDEISADMLKEIQAKLEKHVWMLNAFAAKERAAVR